MPAIIPVLAVASLATTAYGAYEQKKAGDAAAQVDTATAAYNAKYDQALSEQLDADTIANIETERRNDAVYLSKQEAGYASAGVLATTGSPLDAQITNVGRMEQNLQQQWVNAQQQEQAYASQTKAGLAYGAAQAQSDRISGSIALLNGGAKLIGMGVQDVQSGVFK